MDIQLVTLGCGLTLMLRAMRVPLIFNHRPVLSTIPLEVQIEVFISSHWRIPAFAALQTNPASEKTLSIVKVPMDGHGGGRVCQIRPGLWPGPSGMGGQVGLQYAVWPQLGPQASKSDEEATKDGRLHAKVH